MDQLLANNSQQKNETNIRKQLNCWLRIAGFQPARPCWSGFVFIYIIGTTVINAALIPQSSFCDFLAVVAFSFQLTSMILYIYGYAILNREFKKYFEIVLCDKYLTESNYNSQWLVTKQILWTSFIMSFSYISGGLIFWEYDNKTQPRFYYAMVTNILDIIRYLPQIVHIAIITAFYRAFLVKIKCIRIKLGILSRKRPIIYKKVKKQQLNAQIDDAAGNDYSLISKSNSNKVSNNVKLEVTQVNISDITSELQKGLRPYYVMGHKKRLAFWIGSYMFLNMIIMIFFWAAILSPSCSDKESYSYYIHYLLELVAYFVAWIYLVIPMYRCHRELSEIVADVRESYKIDSIAITDDENNNEFKLQLLYTQYTAIMANLNGKVKDSPFSIAGWKVTISRMLKIVLFVFSTVIFDLMSNYGGFKFWKCN